MAAELTPVPKFRAFDSSGNPLAGGKLYAYTAGTTTPLDTYTSDTGGVANTNPIILDANGEANVWLGSASYKLILKNSADVQQWSVDNINAAVTGTGSKVRATSPTIVSPTISTGVAANGSGVKHKRITTGSITASTTSSVSVSWTSAFADANYTLSVSVVDTSGSNLQVVNIPAQSASGFSVNIKNNDGGSAHTGTIHAIAVHD